MTRPGKRSSAKAGVEPRSVALETDALPLCQRRASSFQYVAFSADRRLGFTPGTLASSPLSSGNGFDH